MKIWSFNEISKIRVCQKVTFFYLKHTVYTYIPMHVTWHTSMKKKIITIICMCVCVRLDTQKHTSENWVTITLLCVRDKLTFTESACLKWPPTTTSYFDWAIFCCFFFETHVYKSRCKFSVKKIINNVTRRLRFPGRYMRCTYAPFFFFFK